MERPLRLADEDLSDYARVLDEATASDAIRALLPRSFVSPQELRAGALRDGPKLAAAAHEEYERYSALRRRNGVPPLGVPEPLSGPASQERGGAG